METQELEELLKKYAGTGDCVKGGWGEVEFKERIDFGKIIGNYVQEGYPEVKLPTSRGIIHYSKEGMHIVPSNPVGY